MQKPTTINSFSGEFAFLSNFYECSVHYNNLSFQSAEAAFQAQKTCDYMIRRSFTSLNPSEAKRRGRSIQLRPGWDEIKVLIMTDIVRAKFEQNEDLAEKLLATGNAHLEEGNTWNDRFWGTCGGYGANRLGRILMDVRALL